MTQSDGCATKLQVAHLSRKPGPGHFSIEGLFKTMRAAAGGEVEYVLVECPRPSQGLVPRILNLYDAWRRQCQINHIVGDVHYLAMSLPGHNTILTVHDCGPAIRGNNWMKREMFRLLWLKIPCRRVARICTVSEKTRQEVMRLGGVPPEKVQVIPNCISNRFQPEPRQFRKERPRILQIGTKPNKNVVRVIHALSGIPCDLHLIGEMTPELSGVLQMEKVSFLNEQQLSDRELMKAYVQSDLVIFASTYEGFGMPIAEANAVGRPVVTSNIEPMSWVAGDSAIFVDPYDIGSIRNGVLRCIEDDAYREKLIQRGFQNAERFRAATMASAYEAVYREVYEEGRRH